MSSVKLFPEPSETMQIKENFWNSFYLLMGAGLSQSTILLWTHLQIQIVQKIWKFLLMADE
mgnify:CR=1 FL=1